MSYRAVVIGVSAGGMRAMAEVLSGLSGDFGLPILVVQHVSRDSNGYLAKHLSEKGTLEVLEAEDKTPIVPGKVFLAPPNYHMLVGDEDSLVLSVDGHVNFARPSVDVLFESAAEVYGSGLIGIILTGANDDGSKGLAEIAAAGGVVVVQDPESAEVDSMPRAALEKVPSAKIMKLKEISEFLMQLQER